MIEMIKEDIKKKYGKIAVSGNSDCCCMPSDCNSGDSPVDTTRIIGYDQEELSSIPQEAILGVGCGVPLKFVNLMESETVVDLGSGAGIDVFLSANKVSHSGKVIGVDMTDEMLQKARENAEKGNYVNVEFRKGDIEKNIPIEDNTVDAVISNCVINLTTDKIKTFKEVHRILRKNGRMIISDLITDAEIPSKQISTDQWCACIDGTLTKENYILSMRKAGFENVEILEENIYLEGEKVNGRKITSIVIKAVK